jgi:hypothetical protein
MDAYLLAVCNEVVLRKQGVSLDLVNSLDIFSCISDYG